MDPRACLDSESFVRIKNQIPVPRLLRNPGSLSPFPVFLLPFLFIFSRSPAPLLYLFLFFSPSSHTLLTLNKLLVHIR
jgi:hypothetical protein